MFSPTLALDIELEDVKLPCFVQEKHNGVRFEKLNGRALTRTLKPIPNRYIRAFIESQPWDNIEGEIMVPWATGVNDVVSVVMSESTESSFTLMPFDVLDLPAFPYPARYNVLLSRLIPTNPIITPVTSILCISNDQLKSIVQDVASRHGEGVIIRYNLPYKNGRATLTHPGLLRYVLHATETATIVGYEELFSNENPTYTNELGRTKRSSHQANKVPTNTLGALLVSCPLFPKPFRVGTGFTALDRFNFWHSRNLLVGKTITFEYKPTTVIEVPAPAVFKCINYPVTP